MKRISNILFIIFIVSLSGCGQKPVKRIVLEPQRPVDMPLNDDTATRVSFFEDQDLGDLDQIEKFVLDQAHVSNDMVAMADSTGSSDVSCPESATISNSLSTSSSVNKQVVYFDYDSEHPRQDQREKLDGIKQQVHQWSQEGKTVVFKGHACLWHGTPEYNLALSSQRAQALAQECALAENVKVFGVGNEEPVVLANNSSEEQAPNRRVEIYTLTA